MANRVLSDGLSAIRGTARVVGETFRLGIRAWKVAPAIVAIAMVPEFIQHVVEIRLGMFSSLDHFAALANSSTRWMFGYAKVAGMVIAILAIARFWSVGSVRKTFTMPPADLLRLVIAVGLTWLVSLPFDWLVARDVNAAVTFVTRVASILLQAGLTLYVAAALFGDRSLTLKTAFTERWPTAVVLTIAAFCAFVPLQVVHMFDHRLALGRPTGIVWLLMIWDTLVVGMIASTLGSAIWASYRSGATWRGWAPDFMSASEAAATPDPAAPAGEPQAEPVAGEAVVEVIAEPVAEPVTEPEPAAAPPKRRRPRPGPRQRR